MTKDFDFVRLLREHGPPPRVIWLRCGNTSNAHLRELLTRTLPRALVLLDSGESLVEIADRPRPSRPEPGA
jgi:predicted nuclease of predicted toxin-antitoxin system